MQDGAPLHLITYTDPRPFLNKSYWGGPEWLRSCVEIKAPRAKPSIQKFHISRNRGTMNSLADITGVLRRHSAFYVVAESSEPIVFTWGMQDSVVTIRLVRH